MPEKIVVGPISKGLRNDVTPFNIDNDSFPTLINAYQWRGRIKRKRGTSILGRLKRFFDSTSVSYNSGSTTITLNGSGVGNLITGFVLETNASIVPGSVTLTASGGPTVFTDPTMDGFLTPDGGGVNTINYANGVITIPSQAGNTVEAQFTYYPTLPVMGLEELNIDATQFPGTIAFDTKRAYNIATANPYPITDVSFYKNPASSGTYVRKTDSTPVLWNGQDYQQFWSVNYEAALWVTNGIRVPFSGLGVGMQFRFIEVLTVVDPDTIDITITGHGLSIGDFLFINEVPATTATGINFLTGYITAIAGNVLTVDFPGAAIVGVGALPNATTAIVQYLTNTADATVDCIRYYDGDPTDGQDPPLSLSGTKGWVNFMPPLSRESFSVADLPPAQYYLAGARLIIPFKDRLLFLGPVVQSKALGPIYLQDTIIYSQNGTPYYTATFATDPSLASTTFTPSLLVPVNETAIPGSFWGDQTGFGGFITAGVPHPIITVGFNEDVLIVGFDVLQTRVVYSGNDIVPFNFFIINSELGSSSTFSAINMDQGVISRGSRGIVITGQTQTQRIDLQIPDEIFQFKLTDNGTERVTSQRDFINEWIYLTYPVNQTPSQTPSPIRFPTQTLQYNYRDQSYGIFIETYTTYGTFYKQTGFTWATVGLIYPTWNEWTAPWNAGTSTLLNPDVIAGTPQGFVIIRDNGTGESNSIAIQSFNNEEITSPDHCLNVGDYIIISGATGTMGTLVNGKIFRVYNVTNDTFKIQNPDINDYSDKDYFGLGVIKRMYIPFIQTKEFPAAWGMSRKVRLGPQQYLFTGTNNGQVTLLIFLSQNNSSPYNNTLIVPELGSVNNSLIYSTILFTCPESTNLGLTPANSNLNTPTARQQDQIWHRMNTSLIGDTVQIGLTLNDTQMRDTDFGSQFTEIELHGFILDVSPSQLLV